MTDSDIAQLKERFERELKMALHKTKARGFFSKRLHDSITYAISSAGKRLRPLLVLTTANAHRQKLSLDRVQKLVMPVAIAVELIHNYSLIHDDLPAMDDDDYRRGRLTVHRRYDEALAILTGDALLSDAFFFASTANYNAGQICRCLAEMAGSFGLVAGQSEDLVANLKRPDKARWLAINEAKTARMFAACAEGSLLSLDRGRKAIDSARAFGQVFGEAFQIQDDLLDQAGLRLAIGALEMKEMLAKKVALAKKLALEFENPQASLTLINETFLDHV